MMIILFFLDTSVSSLRSNSQDAVLIIIDEITMLTKHGLKCIDNVLKEIMINQQPFGGKVIVVGGDFRQTLPVVVRALVATGTTEYIFCKSQG